MHARPQRRILRSRSVFAPVRPRVARWKHKQPQGRGALEEMGL